MRSWRRSPHRFPSTAGSERNWDYRYCWIRDAYYTVQALNRLGALDVLEGYLAYLRNIVDGARGGHIQPLYGVSGEAKLEEPVEPGLPGYRGMGPVRVGNQAYEQVQHDAYGQIVFRMYRRSSISASCEWQPLRTSPRSSGSASGPGNSTINRMPAFGSFATGSTSIRIRPPCAGPLVTGFPCRVRAGTGRTSGILGKASKGRSRNHRAVGVARR